ncbi:MULTISPECIES: MlaA family lipoprotein [unclassified Roseovarius]|uniref:MlaA family lipoprotein n=1 Tax=unclassified Roseovarius TaxID=2614913 RepID=UPI00273DAF96|nr:VacJ family lipoprotein [Roseovarius sp. MMSF_3350]
MPHFSSFRQPKLFAACLALVAALAAPGCTPTPAGHPAGQVFDPYEEENRRTHAFNRALDRNLVGPAGKGYSGFIPDDVENMIGRFAFNLSIPGAVVNNILQGNMKGATEDTYRFLVNTTIGLGGLFDTASELNMPQATDADFGQTLHVWGVREGAYIELPLLGPSTERAAAGRIVDLFTNPLTYVLDEPENYYGTVASAATGLSDRGRYADTIDSILYDSADSYAQARSLYIQNRRFKLGGGSGGALEDPYDAELGTPLEDPYDE